MSIRVYYNVGIMREDWKPTRKGIALKREDLPEFAAKVQELLALYESQEPERKESS